MHSGGQNFLFVSTFYEKKVNIFRGFWEYRFGINVLEICLFIYLFKARSISISVQFCSGIFQLMSRRQLGRLKLSMYFSALVD